MFKHLKAATSMGDIMRHLVEAKSSVEPNADDDMGISGLVCLLENATKPGVILLIGSNDQVLVVCHDQTYALPASDVVIVLDQDENFYRVQPDVMSEIMVWALATAAKADQQAFTEFPNGSIWESLNQLVSIN